jgi:hypothetical protein
MIELGINNILGIYRTDTLYNLQDSRFKDPTNTAATKCQDKSQPCIQVKLDLSMFWTRNTGDCDKLVPSNPSNPPCLQRRPFGNDNLGDPNYGGYVITDGTTYAPKMPWYMSHYCDSQFAPISTNPLQYPPDTRDPVCYADYFSTMNDGFNALGGDFGKKGVGDWPNSVPWSVYPLGNPPARDHCPSGQTTCTLVLAGFDLSPVQPTLNDPNKGTNTTTYDYYNNNLFMWFNGALTNFPTRLSQDDFLRHFPWRTGTQVTWGGKSSTDLYTLAVNNPFLGQFNFVNNPYVASCTITLTGSNCSPNNDTGLTIANYYTYPRQCTLADLLGKSIPRLRACGLNYELHHNGWLEEWPPSFNGILVSANMLGNTYGRTSFVFAGVPGMQLPVSYSNASGLNVYEQVYNASIFSLYLPIANEADVNNAYDSRQYEDSAFYHTLLMTNHMESDPWEFAEGIRGKTLWHNEYRTERMYNGFANKITDQFSTQGFPAAFLPQNATAPYHNNTCDGCHVRNGSGIPINAAGTLAVDGSNNPIQQFMNAAAYDAGGVKTLSGNPSDAATDYTFTGQTRPMKVVFFDLQRNTTRNDDSVYSKPLAFSANQVAQARGAVNSANLYYKNTIMNFYGDSFHVTRPGYGMVGNGWNYVQIPANSNRLVVNTPRVNSELGKTYHPLQVNLPTGTFVTSGCDPNTSFEPAPTSKPAPPWPTSCNDINDAAIRGAINGGTVGFMLLNGKRLGNLSAIEAIPNNAIQGFQKSQSNALGLTIAGELQYNAGTRGGVNGDKRLECTTNRSTCFIGRFGWLGDRVSLEDQVANAAFVEMNMTTKAGYKALYPNGSVMPVRYNVPNCGPADKKCNNSEGNADLTEQDINRMAAYARWLGNPTRSEFTASLPDVIMGENIFLQIGCNMCHVIDTIEIPDPNDTMLTPVFRNRLATHVDPTVNKNDPNPCKGKACPFLSYLGTDLLMHDMGYLSQVGNASGSIRDNNGVVLPRFEDFVQKVRTPALKGLRFNRFVTDSHRNTKNTCFSSTSPTTPAPCPACDFLLHDGRACDAIEAAFLHDGPAIKKLGVIDGLPGCKKNMGNECGLNDLTSVQLRQLRAFLYSL